MTDSHIEKPLTGIALKIAGNLIFVVMYALIKVVGTRYPVGEVAFSRSLFAFVPILILTWKAGGWTVLHTARPFAHLRRSLAGTFSMMCNFAAYSLLPLADATVLGFLAPILTTALAAVSLSERVGPYRWSAVILGFGGVVIASSPHFNAGAHGILDLLGPGVILALMGAGATAFAMISIRAMAGTETSLAIVFYFMLVCLIVSGVTLFFDAKWPDLGDAAILIGVGITGGLGQVLMTMSYSHASASTLAPFDYVSIVWALGIDYFLFDQNPESAVLAGAGIVVAAGLFIIYRERRLGLLAQRKALEGV